MTTVNRVLLTVWLVVIAIYLMGVVTSSAAPLVLSQVAAIVVAAFTVAKTQLVGQLRYALAYRAALGLLVAAAGVVLVAAGSTVFASTASGDRMVGFIVLATTNLVVAIAGWRALTRPAPRRAATVAFIAVVTELIAMIIDILLNIDTPSSDASEHAIAVALWASFAATWLGALVSIASITTFERTHNPLVPTARVVDET